MTTDEILDRSQMVSEISRIVRAIEEQEQQLVDLINRYSTATDNTETMQRLLEENVELRQKVVGDWATADVAPARTGHYHVRLRMDGPVVTAHYDVITAKWDDSMVVLWWRFDEPVEDHESDDNPSDFLDGIIREKDDEKQSTPPKRVGIFG